ncbi:MAG: tetratricopeptide repeat protein [Methylococcaceae bacterium]|nr:tetratricopeptide repeat protein [Methylococcaceae bacterium]
MTITLLKIAAVNQVEYFRVIKQLLIPLSGLLLLHGCAKDAGIPIAVEPAADETSKKMEAEAGRSPIDPDLVYLLLSAEIAGQRGSFEKALDGYLEAAERTRDPKIAERATQIALFLRDSGKAVRAVSLWIDSAPDKSSARKAAILVYLSRGDQDQALKHIRYWLAMKESPFQQKMENLVKILDKGLATRLEIMDQLADSYGNDPDFLYAYAVLAFNKNELGTALEKINKALELKPDWDRAIALKARIIAVEGREDASLQMQELVEEYPDNAELGFIYGQYLIKVEDYEAARVQFQKVIELAPENHEAKFGLAGLNLQLNDLDAAKKLFLKLKDVPEWADQSYLFLGRIEKNKGNYKDSLAWFDRVSNGPIANEAGLNAVLVLGKLGRFQEAETRIEELHRRFPDQAVRIDLVRVELLTKRKEYDRALAVLNSALKKHPGQSELLYSRALVAERLDRLDILEADLGMLLRKNPEDVNALNALGYTLVDKTSRFQEAQKYLDQAIKLKPDDPVIIDSYGWLQFKLGNHQKALEYLRRAFSENPDPEIAAHLGEVLWVSGQISEAKDVWHKALVADPQSDYMLNIKNRFPEAFVD